MSEVKSLADLLGFMEQHRAGLVSAGFPGWASEMIQPTAWLRKVISDGGAIMNLKVPRVGGFADHGPDEARDGDGFA